MSGDLAAGSKLPSTHQLMNAHGVTNQTIQRALAVLKREGYLVGRAGSGVYVRERRQQTVRPADFITPAGDGEPYRWVATAGERGQRGQSRIIDVAEVRPPEEIADGLELPPDGLAVLRHQLLLLDDEPAELVWSYYPSVIAHDTPLTQRRRVTGGTPRLLAELGMPPREVIDRVTARLPTNEEFVALDLPDDVPILRQMRVVYTDGRRPIEATIGVKASHLYELEYHVPPL